MSDTGHEPGSEASGRRQRVYWIGLITLPFLFFATCESLVRLAPTSLVSDDPNLNLLFVPTFFERISIEGVDHYRVAHGELYSERGVTFPAIKRDDGFRVFCLGGSASAGWPHPADENWCAYLEAPLARALPDKQVQVINVSAHAYASYRVRLVFQQVMALDPDLILIWSGNNEFLERRTYSDRSRGLERARPDGGLGARG